MSSEDKCFVENKIEFKQKRFEIQKKCIIICIAAVLLLSGYSSCYVLQTSINVEAGLGKSFAYVYKGVDIGMKVSLPSIPHVLIGLVSSV